jgi:hypothetical protein
MQALIYIYVFSVWCVATILLRVVSRAIAGSTGRSRRCESRQIGRWLPLRARLQSTSSTVLAPPAFMQPGAFYF